MTGRETPLLSTDDEHQKAECSNAPALAASVVSTDVALLSALANETRYRTLRLVAQSDDGICGCDLEPALDVSQGAISQALSRLFDAGLVDRRTDGRWRYYSATERAERILAIVDETRALTEATDAE